MANRKKLPFNQSGVNHLEITAGWLHWHQPLPCSSRCAANLLCSHSVLQSDWVSQHFGLVKGSGICPRRKGRSPSLFPVPHYVNTQICKCKKHHYKGWKNQKTQQIRNFMVKCIWVQQRQFSTILHSAQKSTVVVIRDEPPSSWTNSSIRNYFLIQPKLFFLGPVFWV